MSADLPVEFFGHSASREVPTTNRVTPTKKFHVSPLLVGCSAVLFLLLLPLFLTIGVVLYIFLPRPTHSSTVAEFKKLGQEYVKTLPTAFKDGLLEGRKVARAGQSVEMVTEVISKEFSEARQHYYDRIIGPKLDRITSPEDKDEAASEKYIEALDGLIEAIP